ncbi:MAG: DUF3316 domain-containing protein [Bacteroidia bacterium]|nr:DUF3316 domain-containing protein [Bacteroidia bacterium]
MNNAFWIALGLAVGWNSDVSAQQPAEKNYLLTSVTTQYGWSMLNLTDAYLSDLPYSGYGLQFNTTARRFATAKSDRISLRTDIGLNAGLASNEPQSATITYIGGNIGTGVQAHFKPLRNVQVLLGGMWDAEMGVKIYSREVNNATNIDLATNLNLSATLRYDLPLWKNRIRLQADVRSPLLGLMFVPVRGESYSEIYYLRSYENLFHFTSLHNKNGLNVRYLVQIPLKNTILNIGFQTDYLKYAANNMVFRRNLTSMQVGASYDLIQFGGRKNRAPAHFVSSEWYK